LARLNVTRFHQVKPIHEVFPECPPAVGHIISKAMEVNPEGRYQSAAAMQTEIKKAIDRLERGDVSRRSDQGDGEAVRYDDEEDDPSEEGLGFVVMLVESQAGLQNAVRDRLKSRGYRVLIISNPNRALDRFVPGEPPPADLVLFAASEHTQQVPTVLLADRRQVRIIQEATRGQNRKLLALPLKVRELRSSIAELLKETPRRSL
jgi:serine/threonine-protein kinase